MLHCPYGRVSLHARHIHACRDEVGGSPVLSVALAGELFTVYVEACGDTAVVDVTVGVRKRVVRDGGIDIPDCADDIGGDGGCQG